MTPLIPLDSITNVDISIQENHTGTVTICGITKTAAEWRDMASSFSETPKWQPISSAPKDGAQILVAWSGQQQRQVVRWVASRDAWCVNEGGYGEDRYRDEYAPTHWMPLQEAPK